MTFLKNAHAVAAIAFLLVCFWCGSAGRLSAETSSGADSPSSAAVARWPMVFEPNRGQADRSFDFIGRGRAQTVFLNSRGMSVALAGCSFTIKIRNARAASAPQGMEPAGGTSNYFFGSDPARWKTRIPNYRQVRYQNLYPGIDIVYYAAAEGLEFDFLLADGADAKRIELRVEGVRDLSVEPRGLVIQIGSRSILLKTPLVFQDTAAGRRHVPCRYVLRGKNGFGIEPGSYDRSKPLVIDPVLSYSSYLGGSGTDFPGGMALDSDGNIYLTGSTTSPDFPISNAYQSGPGGIFVTKLNPSGTAALYSTFLGGPRDPAANGVGPAGLSIAVDRTGNAFVVGEVTQGSLPLVNALQPAFGGGLFNAFIAKLDPSGSRLLFSTYLGGNGAVGNAVALDADGNPILVGNAGSGFPTTPGALEAYPGGGGNGAFVAKLKASGEALIYSTYLGGMARSGANAVAVDRAGNAYVAGSTGSPNFPVTPGAFQTTIPPAPWVLFPNVCFLSKLNSTGTALVYSTLLGGAGYNYCNAVAVDAQGYAFTAGMTSAADFPVTPGVFQPTFRGRLYCTGGSNCVGKTPTTNAFVARLNPSGSALAYSTYLGGSGSIGGGDSIASISVDAAGNAYIAGASSSNDFPMKEAIQPVRNCTGCGPWVSPADAILAKLDPGGAQLLFSTYIGGSNNDFARAVALDSGGNIVVAGSTSGGSATAPFNDFPVTRTAAKAVMTGEDFSGLPSDAFVLRIAAALPSEAAPSIDSVAPQVSDAAANLFSLNINGSHFTPLSTVYVNGNVQPSRTVSDSLIVASGLRIGGDSAARWAVSVRNMLAAGDVAGISNAIVVEAPLCTIPEPELKLELDPGFWIAEVRAQPGTPEGFWGMEALISGGTLDGGLHFGGGLEQAGRSEGFGAFYVPSLRPVRVQLEARPLRDGTDPSVVVGLFDSGHRQIGSDYRGASSVVFEQLLDQGFYSVAIATEGDQAPSGTFLMSVLSDALAGGLDVGGFLHPGMGGFGAFYLAARQPVTIRTFGQPSYGARGAPCLQLSVYDLARNRIASSP